MGKHNDNQEDSFDADADPSWDRYFADKEFRESERARREAERLCNEADDDLEEEVVYHDFEEVVESPEESKLGYFVGKALLTLFSWVCDGIAWTISKIGLGIAIALKWFWNNFLYPLGQSINDWFWGKHAKARLVTVKGYHYTLLATIFCSALVYWTVRLTDHTPAYYGSSLLADWNIFGDENNSDQLGSVDREMVLASLGDSSEESRVADSNHPFPSLWWMARDQATDFVNSAEGDRVKCLARVLYSEDSIREIKVLVAWATRNRVVGEENSDALTKSFGSGYCGVAYHKGQHSGLQTGNSRYAENMAGEYDEKFSNAWNQRAWEFSIKVAIAVMRAEPEANPLYEDEWYFYSPQGMENGSAPTWTSGCRATHVVRSKEDPVNGPIRFASYRASTCKPLRDYLVSEGHRFSSNSKSVTTP